MTVTEAVRKDIAYKAGELSDYEVERCRLDLYLPPGEPGFPLLVWFHGGGMTQMSKDEAEAVDVGTRLAGEGIGVAVVNYRLSPHARYPAYVEDAAAAVAWAVANEGAIGHDPNRLFVGGHSAGGYLALMIALDPTYLAAHALSPDVISGLLPVSGQTVTHRTVRAERGDAADTVVVDAAAPLYHLRSNLPRTLVLCAEDDIPARLEENQLLVARLASLGNDVRLEIVPRTTHGSVIIGIAEPDHPSVGLVREFVLG